MAVLQMQRISIYGLRKDRKQILELLQRKGVVEISDLLPEDSVFGKTDVSSPCMSFERNISSAKEAYELVKHYQPDKKSLLSFLQGRKEITTGDYDTFHEKYDRLVSICNRMNHLAKEIAELKAEILKLQTQLEILTPWTLLDIPMNFSGTKYTKVFIGTLSNQWTLDVIYEQLADNMPLNVDIISSSKEQTCIFVLCAKEKADSVYEVLREIDFSLPSITFDQAPAEKIDELNRMVKENEAAISKAEEEIKSYSVHKDDILFLQDYDTMRLEKYHVIGHLLQTKNVFVMTGFIPEKDGKALSEKLTEAFDLFVEIETPSEEDDVPVLLKNNGFSSPLEGTVAAFSLPGKGEVDPTMVMSLFYYILFGLMLSDAGYGALMVLACGFALLKFKNTMEPSMKKTCMMYLLCGVSTVFWGVMFGSYFGDLIDVASATYFGHKVSIPPLWFFPVNEPMRMLSFSMLLGMVHLFAGLGMKLYQLLRQKDYKAILYDVIFWYVLLTSLVLLLLSMKMITDILGINITLPAGIVNAAKILAILSAVGIIVTNGRESRNPFKRFLKGLYALYGVSGYLGDVLSYSRLLALGLATGVIGTVINTMASMVGGGFIGAILFIIINIVGHTLNFAINALGAYVHTSRLQYVEFFGKFYEGGGRLYRPFGVNTKYFKFKENE